MAFGPVLDGLAFFEQLQSLWVLVRKHPAPLRLALMQGVVDFAARVYESESATWAPFRSWAGHETLQRFPAVREARLSTLLTLAAEADAPSDLPAWITERLEECVEAWGKGAGDPGAAVVLAERLTAQRSVAPPADWQPAMKILVTADPFLPDDWRGIVRLGTLAPGVFSAEDWEELGQEFLRSAESYLVGNSDNIDSHDEIETLSVVAEELDVKLDPAWVEHAREELGRKEDMLEERRDMEYEDWRETRGSAPAGSLGEMDILFDRLAES